MADDWDDNQESWGDVQLEEAQTGAEDIREDEIRINNLFDEASDPQYRKRDPSSALAKLEECVRLETEAGPLINKRCKALMIVCILHFTMRNYDKLLTRYNELLSYIPKIQIPNERRDLIMGVLNAIETAEPQVLEKVYNASLTTLRQLEQGEKFWFEVMMKLCKIYLDQQNTDAAMKILTQLHASCQRADGTDDLTKGSQLLEIYALEIKLVSDRKDTARVKEVFAKTNKLVAAVNDPHSMSIIRECWGKAAASQGHWAEAYSHFWQAFLQYQETGDQKARQCLKYVIVANLLAANATNPFDAQEAQALRSDSEIQAVVQLRTAFEKDDVKEFEKILKQRARDITSDPFIRENVDELLTQIRSRALVNMIAPYRKITLQYLADSLTITVAEVERLLTRLILDERLHGRIDQIKGILDLTQSVAGTKFQALSGLATSLQQTGSALSHRIE